MITDQLLIAKVHRIVSSRKRRHVTSADVLAVMQKESSGVPIFKPEDALFKANLKAAMDITGCTKEEILKIMTIEYGPLQGQIAKFRCEPGYWQWAERLKGSWSKTERMLLACSLGVGQKMVRWLTSGVAGAEWIKFSRQFAGNIDLQIQYCAGDLDSLLSGCQGNRAVAYTLYNEGTRIDPKTKEPLIRVTDYGKITLGYYKSYVGAGH